MFRSRLQAKMDSARALGLMGFTSTRFMDQASGSDPKTELDKALFNQMQKLSNKRRQATKEKREQEKKMKKSFKGRPTQEDHQNSASTKQTTGNSSRAMSKEEKYADEVLALHEAYQFLIKKHVIALEARQRLSHVVGTIAIAKKVVDTVKETRQEAPAIQPKVEEDDCCSSSDDDMFIGTGVEFIPCGACDAIKRLGLLEAMDSD